jgi:7-cyano-7-deazaguanine reductase
MLDKKLWQSIDGSVLKALPNTAKGYEQKITIPEFTFLGVKNQPDFGHITLWFYGDATTIELKSLKEYIFQYRDTIISYERCIDVMYKHLMETYIPTRIRLEIDFRPRGGISSKMTADSNWGHLGGTDDAWKHHKD